jgi:nicotinamidase/pyrazinamidase
VTDVTIVGLATDYCVKYTALDALMLGFNTTVVADACRGVEVTEGDTARAVAEMAAAGVHVTESRRLLDAS